MMRITLGGLVDADSLGVGPPHPVRIRARKLIASSDVCFGLKGPVFNAVLIIVNALFFLDE
jgi:hypothetical protein